MIEENTNPEPPAPDPELRKKSRRAMVKYGLARLGLFLVLTVIIHGIVLLVNAPVMLRKAHKAWVEQELAGR